MIRDSSKDGDLVKSNFMKPLCLALATSKKARRLDAVDMCFILK